MSHIAPLKTCDAVRSDKNDDLFNTIELTQRFSLRDGAAYEVGSAQSKSDASLLINHKQREVNSQPMARDTDGVCFGTNAKR